MVLFQGKTDRPAVSIIIPFYNAEKYIERCLDSIIYGTKLRYEIICVDDGSTDGGTNIVKKYCMKTDKIRLITLPKNRGLFLARLEGVTCAIGRYIGFVDSDDYVAQGYFDKLYHAAKRHGTDIAVGQIVNVDLQGVKYVQTRCAEFPYRNDVQQSELYKMYWEQSGQCYHWHVLWNKLYKRKLWQRAISVLRKQTEHVVMLEDFIFSSVVLASAKTYVTVISARYFYVAHPDAATSSDGELKKVLSNISSMHRAFNFVESFLSDNCKIMQYIPYLIQWRQRYGRYWERNIANSSLNDEDKAICKNALMKMNGGEGGSILPEDEFYYKKADILEE